MVILKQDGNRNILKGSNQLQKLQKELGNGAR